MGLCQIQLPQFSGPVTQSTDLILPRRLVTEFRTVLTGEDQAVAGDQEGVVVDTSVRARPVVTRGQGQGQEGRFLTEFETGDGLYGTSVGQTAGSVLMSVIAKIDQQKNSVAFLRRPVGIEGYRPVAVDRSGVKILQAAGGRVVRTVEGAKGRPVVATVVVPLGGSTKVRGGSFAAGHEIDKPARQRR